MQKNTCKLNVSYIQGPSDIRGIVTSSNHWLAALTCPSLTVDPPWTLGPSIREPKHFTLISKMKTHWSAKLCECERETAWHRQLSWWWMSRITEGLTLPQSSSPNQGTGKTTLKWGVWVCVCVRWSAVWMMKRFFQWPSLTVTHSPWCYNIQILEYSKRNNMN